VPVECVQHGKQWQCPELKDDRREHATIDRFAEVAGGEQADSSNHVCGNAQKIGLYGAETKATKGEGQVIMRWSNRDCRVGKTK